LGVLPKKFDFLEENSHFLGGHREKNTKNCPNLLKNRGDFEKKRFFEIKNRVILAKNSVRKANKHHFSEAFTKQDVPNREHQLADKAIFFP
jgi:hypothetical protein